MRILLTMWEVSFFLECPGEARTRYSMPNKGSCESIILHKNCQSRDAPRSIPTIYGSFSVALIMSKRVGNFSGGRGVDSNEYTISRVSHF